MSLLQHHDGSPQDILLMQESTLVVLQANPLSSNYVKDIPQASTWFQKVQAGTSGSRSGISVWQTQYDKGKADWNKTSGGGG